MIRAALLLASSLVSGFTFSETIDVEYSRFYSHIKKLDNEDTQALQFAFGFIRVGEGRLCGIEPAEIVTDKKNMPLDVSEEGRFTVPAEKALKLANALVRISLEERANVCDMSVQLETKSEYLKQYYSIEFSNQGLLEDIEVITKFKNIEDSSILNKVGKALRDSENEKVNLQDA